MIWRGFGVCLVECMASLIESFERSSVGPYLTPSEGCRQRLPSTAGIVCGGAIDGSPRVAPTSRPAPPIYKLEALPADGMSAAAAEWWGLRHAPGGQLSGKPTLLLSGKKEVDHTEAFAERAQMGREPLRRGSTKQPITGVVACCARAARCEEIRLSGAAFRTAWEARTAGMGRLQTHACSKKPVTRSPRRRARAATAAR